MKKWFKKIMYITISIVLIAVAVNMFLGPHNIAAGGITGLAIILEELYNIDRSLVVFIFNMGILIITYIFLGKEVFFNTVIGALFLPIVMGFIPQTMLVNDTMLSMIVGSILFGIAVSILYNNNASSGGTSIPPLILKKYFNISTSIGLFITDGMVVILSLFVFSVDSFFFAITSIFITSAAMNYIESGINKKKIVYIISDMSDTISQDIMKDISKGVTMIPIIGAYKKKEMHMLMITLGSKEYHQLVSIVNKYDKDAFMITDTVSDVHGRGFTYESGSV